MFVSFNFRRTLQFAFAGFFAASIMSMTNAVGPIKSNLLIEPGQQFVLGGDQPGAFFVSGVNSGPVAVRVVERFASGDTLGRGVLAPGAKAGLKFEKGSAALIINKNSVKATLNLKITGDTNLGMTYEGAGQK
jgi:hypothetical protein